jgi:hypothetical protein
LSGAQHNEAILHVAHIATRARRQDLTTEFVRQHGWVVQSGPFAGMVLNQRAAWGDGDMLPKLLGCYEAELHPFLARLAERDVDLVVNIGAAEGYYAIGLARMLPNAFIHAFDSKPEAADICRETARLNSIESRVSVAGECSTSLLQTLLIRGKRAAVVCDCEGCERVLLDPRAVPALASATLLIECHDFIDPSITQTLVDRLSPTHDLIGVREGARDPNAIAFLQPLNSLDRWVAVCEYRPCMMHWMLATPKQAGG